MFHVKHCEYTSLLCTWLSRRFPRIGVVICVILQQGTRLANYENLEEPLVVARVTRGPVHKLQVSALGASTVLFGWVDFLLLTHIKRAGFLSKQQPTRKRT